MKAGSLLENLVVYAPHILIGGMPWLDIDDEEGVAEAVRMTAVMRGR